MNQRRLRFGLRACRALIAGASLRAGLVALVLLLASQTCHADFFFSLSSASDLNNLTPGQVVTIQVALSGLDAGDQLDFLAATVVFDSDLLGVPTITPGPIIPDLTGFTPGESKGVADGLYDSLFAASGTPITTDGIFYSFDVTVLGAGSGLIAFDFVDSSGVDSLGAPLPVVTAGGALTVRSVPEPSSWLLCGTGLLGLLGIRAARPRLVGRRSITGSRPSAAS